MLPIVIDIDDSKGVHAVGKSKTKEITQNIVRLIFSDDDSRHLFFFILLTISMAFLELFYGIWTNSLGLISDAFHMFFDCTGLLAGLGASIMMRWKPNERFSYGYGRAEVMGGFINGLLLLFISFFIFAEAAERAIEPPEVKHERLFLVSVLGLIVNLIGIFVFRHGSHHGHSHGVGGGHGHSHGGHSHDYSSHSHSHNGSVYADSHGHSHNSPHGSQIMQGVFLHVLADTLGSVGVIISSSLMYMFGWMIADPICSMFIAILIFVSVLGLLRDTGVILMQRTPYELDYVLPGCYQRVRMLPGVFDVQEPHFWTLCSGEFIGNIKLEVSAAVDPRSVIQQAQAIFTSAGVKKMYVQLDFPTM